MEKSRVISYLFLNIALSLSVPVDDLSISMIGTDGTYSDVAESGVVTLTGGVEGGIACRAHVQGSLTPPEMRIYIDDVEQNAETFVATPTSENADPGTGMPYWTADMLREYRTSRPDPEFNGKTLRCEADMEGYDTVVATATIVVQCKLMY